MFLCKKGKLNPVSGKKKLHYDKLAISMSTKPEKKLESPTTLKKRCIGWKCNLTRTVMHLSLCFAYKAEK